MSVWFVIPSARPPEEAEKCLSKWRERGYKIALFVDEDDPRRGQNCVFAQPYEGYAKAVNYLARFALAHDPSCDWVVTGGDDTDPDPNHTAEEIAAECSAWFSEVNILKPWTDEQIKTFGVCQPTGDRFAFSKAQGSAPIDRVAGSPWLGREWCLRANQGKGPLWPEYKHDFVDEELQNVAIKYGVFWQRPDLIHLHHHYQRETDAIDSKAVGAPVPPHLREKEANRKDNWDKYKAIFENRKRSGFPGSEPL